MTANILSLQLGPYLRDEAEVFNNIVERQRSTYAGALGIQQLMRDLPNMETWTSRKDRDQPYPPSWGYMFGATTIWELWNGDTANPA